MFDVNKSLVLRFTKPVHLWIGLIQI